MLRLLTTAVEMYRRDFSVKLALLEAGNVAIPPVTAHRSL